jgi:hypothetical protein
MAGGAIRDRESISGEVIDAVVARVRDENGVAVSALRLGKLSARAHAELLSVLARANLEHTGKAIRVPLRDQVQAAVERAGETGIPTKALAREVKGARSSAELGLVIRDLIADGKLVIVAEGRAQRAAAPGPQWLRETELAALAEVAQTLAALAKATRAAKGKPRPTLGREVFQRPLQVLKELAGNSGAEVAQVRDAMRLALELAPSHAGLVRVPDVVRALETDYAHGALLDALDAMARDGTLELRPESAIAGLSDEDRARCPVALDGTPLSYARLLAGGRP